MGQCWYQKPTLQSLFSAAAQWSCITDQRTVQLRNVTLCCKAIHLWICRVSPEALNWERWTLHLQTENSVCHYCYRRLFFFPPLAEPSSGCVIWHTVLTPDALPNTTLCIGTGLCIPIGPHQVSASCQRTLWHVGCRGQTSNHWTSNQWTTTLTPELLPTTTNG